MTDPITAATIAGLALSKFAESGASEAAKKLIENLWGAIASRFKGRKKAEEAIAKIEASKGQAPESEANLVRVLDAELFEDEGFAQELQQLAQQIINIQNQSQSQQTNTNYGRDMFVVNQPSGDLKLGGS
jgi:hypothetical protein